jgi:hypothetical protein
MSGTKRLPGGERRKASQRKARRSPPPVAEIKVFRRAGEPVKWQGRSGLFRRDVGDNEHSEIAIGEGVYRVRTKELEFPQLPN